MPKEKQPFILLVGGYDLGKYLPMLTDETNYQVTHMPPEIAMTFVPEHRGQIRFIIFQMVDGHGKELNPKKTEKGTKTGVVLREIFELLSPESFLIFLGGRGERAYGNIIRMDTPSKVSPEEILSKMSVADHDCVKQK